MYPLGISPLSNPMSVGNQEGVPRSARSRTGEREVYRVQPEAVDWHAP